MHAISITINSPRASYSRRSAFEMTVNLRRRASEMRKAAPTDRTIDATSTGPCTPISPIRGMLAGSTRDQEPQQRLRRHDAETGAGDDANGIASAKNCRASRDRVAPRMPGARIPGLGSLPWPGGEIRQVDAARQKQNSDRCEQQEQCLANRARHAPLSIGRRTRWSPDWSADNHAPDLPPARPCERELCSSVTPAYRRATQVAIVPSFSELTRRNVQRRPESKSRSGYWKSAPITPTT